MMKKIGCVIAYGGINFGTLLQDYATLAKIKEFGYECEVIRYKKHLSFFEKVKLIFRMIQIGDFSGKRRELNKKWHVWKNKDYAKSRNLRIKASKRFGKKYLEPFFVEYDGYEALCKGSHNYDLVLVGSDQIWSPISLYGNYYNLMFVDENIPKVSYASSFGVREIPDFQKSETKRYLDRLSMIGVREESGKAIVDSLSKNSATVVADPTMLLSADEWNAFIGDSSIKIDVPYIFCYYLGTNVDAREAVMEWKRKTGLKIVAIKHGDEYFKYDELFGDISLNDVDPKDFLKLIKNAEYVCTDSFHCSVFSILFHKKFMSFYRFRNQSKISRNTRIDNLLSLFNLQERLYKDDILQIEKDINYAEVDNCISDYRVSSLNFLKKELELANKQ